MDKKYIKCKKCGSKIKVDSKYCIRCGEIIANYSLTEEEKIERSLIYAYRGNKEYSGNFSFLCLFFSFAYLSYKKMYAEAFLCFISEIILLLLVPNFFTIVESSLGFYFLITSYLIFISLFTIIYYARNFKRIYLELTAKKVYKVMIDNKEKSFKEIEKICQRNGKPNLAMGIISIIFFIIFIFIYSIYK